MYIYMNTILSVTRCLGPVWKTALSLVIIGTLQIINYVTNSIQFQGGNKIFYIYSMKNYNKKFLYLFCAQ